VTAAPLQRLLWIQARVDRDFHRSGRCSEAVGEAQTIPARSGGATDILVRERELALQHERACGTGRMFRSRPGIVVL
jgi:hypothetical protein